MQTRRNAVRNRVVVNADSKEEAARKGLSYFRYTSRDNYAISKVTEISPGKWQVEALMRNPTANEKGRRYSAVKQKTVEEEVREPYTSEDTNAANP